MTPLLDRARALLAAATPGPWQSMFHGGALRPAVLDVYQVTQHITALQVAHVGSSPGSGAEPVPYSGKDGDAALIAAAPTLITELADEVERLRDALQRIHDLGPVFPHRDVAARALGLVHEPPPRSTAQLRDAMRDERGGE